MEAKPVALVKPTRHPDYITSHGSAFWFDEMLWMGVDSILYPIVEDVDSGMLMLMRPHPAFCGVCENCDSNKVCLQNVFSSHIQEAKSKWWHDMFEDKFLGDKDE